MQTRVSDNRGSVFSIVALLQSMGNGLAAGVPARLD